LELAAQRAEVDADAGADRRAPAQRPEKLEDAQVLRLDVERRGDAVAGDAQVAKVQRDQRPLAVELAALARLAFTAGLLQEHLAAAERPLPVAALEVDLKQRPIGRKAVAIDGQRLLEELNRSRISA